MAVKISDLKSTTSLSSNDLIQIVDVAAVLPLGMSLTGTNKKITVASFASSLRTIGGYAAATHTHGSATITAAGFMSAADKTKLDGISTLSGSNTGDETASTIKTKLGVTTLSGSNTGDQTITLTGDITGNGTNSFTTTLANSGVTAGEYNKSTTGVTPFTVDSKGRITGTSTVVTITPAWSSITGKPTTLSGYGITDSATIASPSFTGTVTLPAGTVSASPLKLKTGVNLTTAAFGSVEFDGTNLYLTNNSASPTRKTIAFTDSAITSSVGSFTGSLVGDVTGTQSATAISATTVTGKALTGYVSGAGTVSATDTILSAINKLNGNVGLKANLASPTFTGTVTLGQAPTSDLHAATKAYVDGQVAVGGGISLVQQTALDLKANLSGPTFTGAPKAPTASTTTNSTQIATTAYVQNVVQGIVTDGFDFNSPAFTGIPTAPTATTGTNTTQIATTAYVKNAIDSINVGGGGAITSYTVTSNVPTIAEGSTVTFTVLTNSQATTLYWTTDATDVSPVSGTIILNSGVGTFTVTALADGIAETNDNFIVYVRTGGPTGTVVANCLVNISDTGVVAPGTDTYIVTPNVPLIAEGSDVTFTVVVNTATPTTTLYWSASPAADVNTLSGQFTIEGNVGTFTTRAKVDAFSEGIELLTVSVRTGSTTGPVVATCVVSISDNPVSISMTPSSTTIVEGESVTFNVTATNTPGTTMYWTTDSNATTLKSDSVGILNNAGSFSVKAATNDVWSGTTQSFIISLRLVNITGPIVAQREITVLEGSGEATPVWERQATNTILTKQSVFNGSGDIAAGITATGGVTVMRYNADLVWKTADAISLTAPGTTAIAMNSSGNVIALVDTSDTSGNRFPVKIYKWNGSAWSQLGQGIYPPNNYPVSVSAGFTTGINMALNGSGTRLVIGQPGYIDVYGGESQSPIGGLIRMYEFNAISGPSGSWQQIGNDIKGYNVYAQSTSRQDRVGTIVAMNSEGDRIVNYRMQTWSINRAYPTIEVYQWNTGSSTWTQLGSTILPNGTDTNGITSLSFSDDGNRIAVGNINNSNPQYLIGTTKVYQWNNAGTWVQIGNEMVGEAYADNSGISVSLNGDGTRVAISAPNNDDAGLDIGHTRVYRWDTSTNKWIKIGLDISWPTGTNDQYSHRKVDINYAGDAVIISGNGATWQGSTTTNVVTNNRVYKLA